LASHLNERGRQLRRPYSTGARNGQSRRRGGLPHSACWFKTFAMNVSQIYDAGEMDEPVELKIELDKAAN
jgi:hypothetical protein